MQERDEGAIFAEPVDKQLYPEYYQVHLSNYSCLVRDCNSNPWLSLQVITNPMDLGTVMQNLQCGPLLPSCSAASNS